MTPDTHVATFACGLLALAIIVPTADLGGSGHMEGAGAMVRPGPTRQLDQGRTQTLGGEGSSGMLLRCGCLRDTTCT